MKNLNLILAAMLWLVLSGFTGTINKNDGSAWSGLTVQVVNYYTGAIISSTTTNAAGQYVLNLPSTGMVKLVFKTAAGTRVRPEIPLHVDAIAEASESLMTVSALDSLAFDPVSSIIPASQVWGHTIKSQAEMLPYYHFRFDDFGAGWSDQTQFAATVVECMSYGHIPSISTNVFLMSTAADSLALQSIVLAVDTYGIRPEWLQHGNTSIVAGAYGNTLRSSSWDDLYRWSYADWVLELDPQHIINRVNAISAAAGSDYRITANDVIGAVWPGDNNPVDKNWLNRSRHLLERVFDDVGLEYAVTSPASADSSHFWHIQHNNSLEPNQTTTLLPFCYADARANRTYLAMPFTTDLANKVVERGGVAKVPWAPAGTAEWTLATRTNYSEGAYPPTSYTDATVSNFSVTARSLYLWGLSTGAGFGYVFHPGSTPSTAYNLGWPDGGQNNALTVGASVNGGANTFTEPMDYSYIFALVSELRDAGFCRTGSMTDHLRWLASRPGKPGLRVAGFSDPVHPSVAIGDTVGVVPMTLIRGSGVHGFYLAYVGNGVRFMGTSGGSNDADLDGKWEGYGAGTNQAWDDVTHPTERFYLAAGQGPGGPGANNALMIFDQAGINADVYFDVSGLLPGTYVAELTIQSVRALHYRADTPRLYLTGIAETNKDYASYGQPIVESMIFLEKELGLDADSFDCLKDNPAIGTVETGTTDFGNDTWPGGEPSTRQGAWYTHSISFTVPRVPTAAAYDPINDISDGRLINVRGSLALRVSLYAEDTAGGYGFEEHARVGSVQLYWMGD